MSDNHSASSDSPKSPASSSSGDSFHSVNGTTGDEWFFNDTINTDTTKGKTFIVPLGEDRGPVEIRLTNAAVGLDPRYVQARLQLRSHWEVDESSSYFGLSTVPDETKLNAKGRPIEFTQVMTCKTVVDKLCKVDVIADQLEKKTAEVCAIWNERNSHESARGNRCQVSADYVVKEMTYRGYTGAREYTQCVLRIDTYVATTVLQNTAGPRTVVNPADVTISLKYRSTANKKAKNSADADPRDPCGAKDFVFDYHGLTLSAPDFIKLLRSRQFKEAIQFAGELEKYNSHRRDKKLMNSGTDPSDGKRPAASDTVTTPPKLVRLEARDEGKEEEGEEKKEEEEDEGVGADE